MEKFKFSDLDYIFEGESLVIRPDSATNIVLEYSHIESIHLGHANGTNLKRRKLAKPCMNVKMNTGEEYQIIGFPRFISSQEEREGYRKFVIDFHQQLKNHQRGIKFIGGIDFPKPFSLILAVGGAALLVHQFKQEFISSDGVGAALCALVVGVITFFKSGHQYDPNKIPGKFLK